MTITLSRRILVIVAIFVLAYVLVGLAGVFLPPTVSTVERTEAGLGTDPACMLALKQRGVTYDERVYQCRYRLKTVDSFSPAAIGDGYWKWRTGVDWMWRFTTEAMWHNAFVGGSIVVIPDDINCWINYAYVISLEVKTCTWWRVNGVLHMGATYVTSFGPVVEGKRTFIVVKPGSSSGPYTE